MVIEKLHFQKSVPDPQRNSLTFWEMNLFAFLQTDDEKISLSCQCAECEATARRLFDYLSVKTGVHLPAPLAPINMLYLVYAESRI